MIVRVLDKYEIRPTHGGMDYSLYEYREIRKPVRSDAKTLRKSGEKDWVHTGKYAHDIQQGLGQVYWMECRNNPASCMDIHDAVREMAKIRDSIAKTAKAVDGCQ